MGRSGFAGQFVAAVKKNMQQKVRAPISCCVEVLIPIVFILGMVAIWKAVGSDSYPAKNFIVDGPLPVLDVHDFIEHAMCTNATVSAIPTVPTCRDMNLTMFVPSLMCKHNIGRGTVVHDLCATLLEYPGFVRQSLEAGMKLFSLLNNHSAPRRIPSMQDFLKLTWMWQSVVPESTPTPTWSSARTLNVGGKIRFAPNTPDTLALVQYLNRTVPLFPDYLYGGIFDDTAALEAYLKSDESQVDRNWAAIEVRSLSADNFDVSLRLNSTTVSWTTDVIAQVYSGGLGSGQVPTWVDSYFVSGFASLQLEVVRYWQTQVRGIPAGLLSEPIVAPMPYIAYTEWGFLQVAAGNGFFALFMVFAYLYPVSQLVKVIVKEKETRIREAMLIMGLGTGSFYTSWFFTYVFQFLFTSLLGALIMKLTFFSHNAYGPMFVLMWVFSWSAVAFAGLLSTVFSKSRISAIISPVLYFALSMPLFAVDNLPARARRLLLIIGPSALAEGFNVLATHEQNGGMTAAGVFSKKDDINLATVLFFLIFDTILYSLLALYLDAVFPSEWGTRSNPCFCFLSPIRWLSNRGKDFRNEANGRDKDGKYEVETGGNPALVEVLGLRKEFQRGAETFIAVNNLHFTLRKNEVTVLLGHNGAGKSTAINLITGMLEPDDGDCVVHTSQDGDLTTRTSLNQVRQNIALCPQHNILWDELTCYQHLDFYAALKGLSGKEKDDAIIEMLRSVDLLDKKDDLSMALSGGMKRKLHVAIAFVGGSDFVLLDEPTAGMDVAARRFTWDLIRRMSVGRAVLLTTHYMDEADLLGQKICIMAKGRMKCEGSPMFLKQSYSVGYTLTMSVDPTRDLKPLHSLVKETVQGAEHLPTGAEEVAYRLPMAQAAKFPEVFTALETTRASDFGVRGFGVTVTTLEEVFLRITHEEEAGKLPVEDLHESRLSRDAAAAATGAKATPMWATRASEDEKSFGRQFIALCAKRFHNIKRDRRTQVFQIVVPVVGILFSMLLLNIQIIPKQPALNINATMYARKGIYNPQVDIANCAQLNGMGFPAYSPVYSVGDNMGLDSVGFSNYLQQTFSTHGGKERYISFFCDDSFTGASVLLHNYTALHGIPEAIHLYSKGMTDALAGGNATMKLESWPMPSTNRQDALFSAIRSFMVGIVILIPFTFVPSTFVSWVVKEKECKAKHLQLVSGMSYYTYWLANFVFDICSFLVTMACVFIIFFAFDRTEYVGDGAKIGGTFMLLFLYGLSGVTAAYFISFFFDEHSTAQNVVMMGNFIAGFVCVFLIFMLGRFDNTKNAADVLVWIFRIVPSFCLGNGVINMAGNSFATLFHFDDNPFKMDTIGWNLVYMSIEFPLFFGLTLLLDHPGRKRRTEMLSFRPDDIPPPIEDEEEDVKAERLRVDRCFNGSSPQSPRPDVVVVQNMRKVYDGRGGAPPKVAVKNLTFGVKQGEVFGFLGTNGAGKTTTISILCGEQLPTNGKGIVKGYDVVMDGGNAQRHIGYCPQFDALLELLTAQEHLCLYAGLRGVPRSKVSDVVNELITVVGLDEHRHTLAGKMSGGNKRKLSVAIALVGGPSVVFLDEPSAGMDPLARRGLWEVIDDIAREASVVLTTHHLEEIEALAHRVAIMVAGQLMCIGDKTHLKNKYGTGFEMSVRLSEPAACPVFEDFVLRHFPGAELRERRGTKYAFALPKTIPLSRIFRTLEEKKREIGVEDYSVAQTSIEAVFLRISDAAEHEADEPFSPQAGSFAKGSGVYGTATEDRYRDPAPAAMESDETSALLAGGGSRGRSGSSRKNPIPGSS